jgi:thiamine biosynthesis lipoprotein
VSAARPLAALLLAAAVSSMASCGAARPLTRTEAWLGTVCSITVYRQPPKGLLDKAFARIAEIDARMGPDRPGSELDPIAAAAGKAAVKVTPDVFKVIQASLAYSRLMDGAFDVSIGPLVKLWGIGLGGTGRVPPQPEIEKARALVDYRRIELDPAASTVRLRDPGMSLDLGGIAKGYAADEAAAILRDGGVKSAIIDLGGNILVIGSRPGGGKWRIGIQDPDKQRGEYLGIVDVSDATVVTSGVYERYFIKDGVRYHHILDPKTGAPARTGLLSTTVVTRQSMEADALAKIFVLGVERGMALVKSLPGVQAIFVTEDHKVIISPGLASIFRVTSPAYTLVPPGSQ